MMGQGKASAAMGSPPLSSSFIRETVSGTEGSAPEVVKVNWCSRPSPPATSRRPPPRCNNWVDKTGIILLHSTNTNYDLKMVYFKFPAIANFLIPKLNMHFLNRVTVFLTAVKLCILRKAHCSPPLVGEDYSIFFTSHSVPFPATRDLVCMYVF